MASADDGLLVDAGFFAQSNFSKEAKAAANECLMQMLEAGPSLLEPVKEAVGALKALCTGVLTEHYYYCYLPCSFLQQSTLAS